MSRTQLAGNAILDGSLQRTDMDVTTPGQAVITKVIAGDEIEISSTGGDAGTGDVTVKVSSAVKTHVNSTHAPSDAQKNEYITKAEIEAKLTGEVNSHIHGHVAIVQADTTGFGLTIHATVATHAELPPPTPASWFWFVTETNACYFWQDVGNGLEWVMYNMDIATAEAGGNGYLGTKATVADLVLPFFVVYGTAILVTELNDVGKSTVNFWNGLAWVDTGLTSLNFTQQPFQTAGHSEVYVVKGTGTNEWRAVLALTSDDTKLFEQCIVRVERNMGDSLRSNDQILGEGSIAILCRNFTWQTAHDSYDILGARWTGPSNLNDPPQAYERLLFMHFRDTGLFEKDARIEEDSSYDYNNWVAGGVFTSLGNTEDANGNDGSWGNVVEPDSYGRLRRFSHSEAEKIHHVPVPHLVNDLKKLPQYTVDGIVWVQPTITEFLDEHNRVSNSNQYNELPFSITKRWAFGDKVNQHYYLQGSSDYLLTPLTLVVDWGFSVELRTWNDPTTNYIVFFNRDPNCLNRIAQNVTDYTSVYGFCYHTIDLKWFYRFDMAEIMQFLFDDNDKLTIIDWKNLVSSASKNVDGGSPESVYLASQVINGGNP